ncbi:hypothetical protein OJ997_05270 [Solirubrobacter phytolaccae]|uniref:Uncharacterized protein n=1 Tax=Solirubrobacter phytolaccae TaxID=1404360 RepID=A0A9X3N7E1_9ACTN|nr:hypothetical protein [Solirubrobacter phytolaccae]MDA0179694.1 hypothetical protein [Solirubrobacter phytolaccae]
MILRIVLIVLALAVVGTALWPGGGDVTAGEEALARAETLAQQGRSLTPAALTDASFDRFVVLSGHDTADEIRQTLGFDWKRAEQLGYHCCDPAPLWVFVEADEVVAFFRASPELSYGDGVRPGSYRPDAALSLDRTYVRVPVTPGSPAL